jgi:hypothetical protein
MRIWAPPKPFAATTPHADRREKSAQDCQGSQIRTLGRQGAIRAGFREAQSGRDTQGHEKASNSFLEQLLIAIRMD